MPEQHTVTVTTYSLSELTGSARQNALEKLAAWATDDEWWYEFSITDAKTIGKLFGFEISDIYFSGFSSQGDGACAIGTYSYRKGSLAAVKDYAPQDEKLHAIVAALQKIQRRYFYRLTAEAAKISHHYSHENTVGVEVSPEATGDDAIEIQTLLRDYMRWIYRSLETEYEYRTSEAACVEMDEANGYRWSETGSPA